MNFEQFNLDSRLMQGIKYAGYETATPIQEAAIPAALRGRDIIGTAQTGTGKTAAFVLPILNKLLDGPRGMPRALIVTPTRELAGAEVLRVVAPVAVGADPDLEERRLTLQHRARRRRRERLDPGARPDEREAEREVDLPAGTQPGHTVSLSKLGLPSLRSRRRDTPSRSPSG